MKLSPDKTLLEYFYYREKHQPDNIYLRQPFGDAFKDFTWKEVGQQARKIAAYLKSLNLPPKSNIAQWLPGNFCRQIR